MTYQQFQTKWLGRRVDIDKLYGYQCADLVKQYMLETQGIPNGAYGNAVDYWYRPHKNVLARYDRIQTSAARQGDIVVLKGINGNPYGHIGIGSGSTNLITTQILEQNGSTGNGSGLGGDAIRLRHIPRWRVLGVLRPKAAPTPVTPPTGGHRYAWAVGKTVYLTGDSWRVYKIGSIPPRTAVATLRPNKFGGLRYMILATDKAPNSVVIQTQQFGRVSLPLGYGEKII